MTSPNVREIKRGSAHTRVLPLVVRTNIQRDRERGFTPLPYGRKRAIEPTE